MSTHSHRNLLIWNIERLLFNVRWALIPFYIGLVVVLFYYGFFYFKEVVHYVAEPDKTIDGVKLFALDTIDIVMIGNLIKMIITGSYNSFVDKGHGYTNENVSSGQLKIKIATSVVVLSMIYMLKEFVAGVATWETIVHQSVLFAGFLIAAVVLSVIEYLHSLEHVHKADH
jgi:uncharacterized protein (TIGR00645 family)